VGFRDVFWLAGGTAETSGPLLSSGYLMCSGLRKKKKGQWTHIHDNQNGRLTRIQNMCKVVSFGRGKRFASKDEDFTLKGSHGMSGPARWRRTHALEHVPPLIWEKVTKHIDRPTRTRTRYFESHKVAQIHPINAPTTKYVHDISNNGCSMAFARVRNKADAVQLCPCTGLQVERPSVVVVILPVRSPKT